MARGARLRCQLPEIREISAAHCLSVAQFRKNAKDMVDWICDYYASNEKLPVRSEVEPGYLRPLLPKAAPQHPENFGSIMQDVQSKIMPGGHPTILALRAHLYISIICPSHSLYWVSAGQPRPLPNWLCAPTHQLADKSSCAGSLSSCHFSWTFHSPVGFWNLHPLSPIDPAWTAVRHELRIRRPQFQSLCALN